MVRGGTRENNEISCVYLYRSSEIRMMKNRTVSGIGRFKRIRDEDLFTSALAGDAVLVHVQCIEHMRVAVLPLTTGDRCIEVESRTFRRRRTELAVLLQLKGTK